jgi:hypothetical protein
MKRFMTTLIPSLALAALGLAAASTVVLADDAPPASAPDDQGHQGRHHNPAWAACKKQADDQKLEPGDARRDFMKNCMKSAKDSATPPAG